MYGCTTGGNTAQAVVGVPTGSVVITMMPTAWATTVGAAQAVLYYSQ